MNNKNYWFKQMTCDHCFKPLDSIGKHNCFTIFKIIGLKKIHTKDYDKIDLENIKKAYSFLIYTAPQYWVEGVKGYLYLYKIDINSAMKTWFCNKKCAQQYSISNKSFQIYFDDRDDNPLAVTPEYESIYEDIFQELLKYIEDMPYLKNGIMPEGFKRIRFIPNFNISSCLPKCSEKDLRIYGTSQKFPRIDIEGLDIVLDEFSSQDETSYLQLVNDPTYQKMFNGIEQYITRDELKSHIFSIDLYQKRHIGIEWIIKQKNEFIGFFRLHCASMNDPYKWYIEFALSPSIRGKGYMHWIGYYVFKWAKENGLEQNVYATANSNNKPALSVLEYLRKSIDGSYVETLEYSHTSLNFDSNNVEFKYTFTLNNKCFDFSYD